LTVTGRLATVAATSAAPATAATSAATFIAGSAIRAVALAAIAPR
jgi:hypothetical protein